MVLSRPSPSKPERKNTTFERVCGAMQTFQTIYEAELRKLIAVEVERLKENLSHGQSVCDYSEYQKTVGQILGLRTALELCEEANALSERKERNI